ncbi:hypothetical protein Hanom_Chr02g00123211 [Helianthus anomalus]
MIRIYKVRINQIEMANHVRLWMIKQITIKEIERDEIGDSPCLIAEIEGLETAGKKGVFVYMKMRFGYFRV